MLPVAEIACQRDGRKEKATELRRPSRQMARAESAAGTAFCLRVRLISQ
jgi:hypothetical protein